METDNNKTNTPPEIDVEQADTPLTESHHSHIGPILGVLVLILILVLAGLYVWGGMLSKEQVEVEQRQIINNEPETPRAEADVHILQTTSPSDELEAIEADLDGTDLDSLDAELTAIEAELNAALGE